MDALAILIGRLRLKLVTGVLVYKVGMQRRSNQQLLYYRERDIVSDIPFKFFRFS